MVPVYGLNYKDKREDALGWLQQFGNPYLKSISDTDGLVGLIGRFTLNDGKPRDLAIAPADPAIHAPGRNPVADAHARLAGLAPARERLAQF